MDKIVHGKKDFNKLDFNLLYGVDNLFDTPTWYEIVGYRDKEFKPNEYVRVIILRDINTKEFKEHTSTYILEHYPDTQPNPNKRSY